MLDGLKTPAARIPRYATDAEWHWGQAWRLVAGEGRVVLRRRLMTGMLSGDVVERWELTGADDEPAAVYLTPVAGGFAVSVGDEDYREVSPTVQSALLSLHPLTPVETVRVNRIAAAWGAEGRDHGTKLDSQEDEEEGVVDLWDCLDD